MRRKLAVVAVGLLVAGGAGIASIVASSSATAATTLTVIEHTVTDHVTDVGKTGIGPGDYVSFPPGGTPHQLVNDGTEPLVYLAMSALQGFDLVEYPDSDKVACSLGGWPAAKRFVFRRKDQADYFEGED